MSSEVLSFIKNKSFQEDIFVFFKKKGWIIHTSESLGTNPEWILMSITDEQDLSHQEKLRGRYPKATFISIIGQTPMDIIVKCLRQRQNNDDILSMNDSWKENLARLEKMMAPLAETRTAETLIGNSPLMKQLKDVVGKMAASHAPILILGESGVGKEILAQEIHDRSPRHDKPFVAINCVALPPQLLESELFGHEKGAFTGAHCRKIGLLESADKGTIFLDEIAELPESVQVKLLRFLQEKEIRRLGSASQIALDIRVLSATHRNIAEEIKNGQFRQDLYYRLNVFEVVLPPLRERPEDIITLAQHFIEGQSQILHREFTLSPGVIAAFRQYRWPGNIRELKNVIERACLLSHHDRIEMNDLPLSLIRSHPTQESVPDPNKVEEKSESQLRSVEREMVHLALMENGWNQTLTAQKLKIKRSTLQYKMKRFNLMMLKRKAS